MRTESRQRWYVRALSDASGVVHVFGSKEGGASSCRHRRPCGTAKHPISVYILRFPQQGTALRRMLRT